MPKLTGCCPFPVEQFVTPTRGIDGTSESQLPRSSVSRCHWDLVLPAKHGKSFARDDSLVEDVLERISVDDLGPRICLFLSDETNLDGGTDVPNTMFKCLRLSLQLLFTSHCMPEFSFC